ncbi:hypothetical protein K239x_45300 [Planctomycetes bacterium K23_9]|uniref:Uncharacterized protein n=1 Tax=Stieleria marina TaxID=1930275 RepID=A0A517NZG0_9BACT|nr:hypothetical protein K239x_45300 [Planctomycetes bacterium K23_9]
MAMSIHATALPLRVSGLVRPRYALEETHSPYNRSCDDAFGSLRGGLAFKSRLGRRLADLALP